MVYPSKCRMFIFFNHETVTPPPPPPKKKKKEKKRKTITISMKCDQYLDKTIYIKDKIKDKINMSTILRLRAKYLANTHNQSGQPDMMNTGPNHVSKFFHLMYAVLTA